MFLPAFRLYVEYDGNYWHRKKYQRDLWKRQQLTDAGYNVCRIRENLKLTDPVWDLFIDLGMTARDCAITLATHIQTLFPAIVGIDDKAFAEYKNNIQINNRGAALDYLKQKDKEMYARLLAKQKEQLEREKRQRERKAKEKERIEAARNAVAARAVIVRIRRPLAR